MTDIFVATSIARRLLTRMQMTHERRRIGVFAGPPGIGKTTAIDAFKARHVGNVAVVKIGKRNARYILALQHTLEAMRRLTSSPFTHIPNSTWELRSDVYAAMCEWMGVDLQSARRGDHLASGFGPLTIIFDEAQNLSREAIDALRYWNDPDRCYAPFPIGLIFVGNNEFALAPDASGESVISAAVADRALYLQTFDYGEVTDDDLTLVIEASGLCDPAAVAAVLRYFRGPRSVRSLRRLLDFVQDLHDLAGGAEITAATVREALEFA